MGNGPWKQHSVRRSLMSMIFPPVTLGLEMAAPILWAPGIFWFFLLENPHAHKIPRFRGGGSWLFGRSGGSANFIFMGVGFCDKVVRAIFKASPTCHPWRLPLPIRVVLRSRTEQLAWGVWWTGRKHGEEKTRRKVRFSNTQKRIKTDGFQNRKF